MSRWSQWRRERIPAEAPAASIKNPPTVPEERAYPLIRIERRPAEKPVFALKQVRRSDPDVEAKLEWYSRLKLGDPEILDEAAAQMAQGLEQMVAAQANSKKPVIAYLGRTVPTNVSIVAQKIAGRGGYDWVAFRNEAHSALASQYSGLRTDEEREKAVGTNYVPLPERPRIAGRVVVLIDDSYVSGSGVRRAEAALKEAGAEQVISIVAMRIDGEGDQSLERTANMAALRTDPVGILTALWNREKPSVVAYCALASIKLARANLSRLVHALNDEALLNFYAAAYQYGENVDRSVLDLLSAESRSRGLPLPDSRMSDDPQTRHANERLIRELLSSRHGWIERSDYPLLVSYLPVEAGPLMDSAGAGEVAKQLAPVFQLPMLRTFQPGQGHRSVKGYLKAVAQRHPEHIYALALLQSARLLDPPHLARLLAGMDAANETLGIVNSFKRLLDEERLHRAERARTVQLLYQLSEPVSKAPSSKGGRRHSKGLEARVRASG